MITLHHVTELLGHDSDAVVEDRVRFVRRLEQVFWVRGANDSGIGGFPDLCAQEIRALIQDQDSTFRQILKRVRAEVIEFGDSRQASALMEEPVFVRRCRERIRHRRVVASISRTRVMPSSITGRPVIPGQSDVPLKTVLANFDRQQQLFESQLRAVGDPDLANPAHVAKEFYDKLRRDAAAVAEAGMVNLGQALLQQGIADVDVASSTSADLLGDKYVWRRQSGVLARIAGLSERIV